MSGQATGRVFELAGGGRVYSGNTLLVLVKMADCGHDDGTNIFPGRDYVATSCNIDRRTVRRIWRQLEDDGVLVADGDPVGGRGHTRRYRIDFDRLAQLADKPPPDKGGQNATLSGAEKGDKRVAKGWRSCATRTGTRTLPPSPVDANAPTGEAPPLPLEPNQPERAKRATRLSIETLPPSWRDFCRAERPDLDPERVFTKFRDYWISAADGRKRDWFAVWRNWVRGERQSGGQGPPSKRPRGGQGNRVFIDAARSLVHRKSE